MEFRVSGIPLSHRLASGLTWAELLGEMRDIVRSIGQEYRIRVVCDRFSSHREVVASISFVLLNNGNLTMEVVDVEESIDDASMKSAARLRASLRCAVCRTNAPVHRSQDAADLAMLILTAQRAVPPEHRIVTVAADGAVEIPLKVIADVLGTRWRRPTRL